MPGIAESWHIFITNVQPQRLILEDPGVEAPLWFGRRRHSPWHIPANLLRLLFVVVLGPFWILVPSALIISAKEILKRALWGIEWAKAPDAVLFESPGSSLPDEKKTRAIPSSGEYAVTGNKPNWLLEVKFRGTTIISQEQVRYEWQKERKKQRGSAARSQGNDPLLERIRRSGYTAISYSMDSAESLFFELGGSPHDPHAIPGQTRKWSLNKRKEIAQVVLDEYGRARKQVGAEDNTVFIWLDEFCLSDHHVMEEKECNEQRDVEIGQLSDIFRRAKQVVVFCHEEDCDHTDSNCYWGKRLFTLGEILYTPRVLVMTRTREPLDSPTLISRITAMPGHHFREDMQSCAAEARMWHLYNIMQHATNSGAVTWQSAIHSLVVEAIRRDEAGNFHEHRLLGKALNGLLPRRSHLTDLRGKNGWADLAWLLELNQGYYNTTLLAAVCKLADPDVDQYRWWGKPILPKEGSERLEPLVTCIPVKLRKTEDDPLEPALSIIGPQSVPLSEWLRRDGRGLYTNPEMKSLKRWMIGIGIFLALVGFSLLFTHYRIGIAILWTTGSLYVFLELLVGTIFVERDKWIVIEDHKVPDRDGLRWLRGQDPTFNDASEWGHRQLIPQWDTPNARNPTASWARYVVTLFDLRTSVWTKAVVASKPNDMVILAVHGNGITCMLLDREEKEAKLTTAAKVGMASLPPFVLAQTRQSGTVYIGDIRSRTRRDLANDEDTVHVDPMIAMKTTYKGIRNISRVFSCCC